MTIPSYAGDRLTLEHPRVYFGFYIDDLHAATVGKERDVETRLVEAAYDHKTVIEVDWKSKIAVDKCAVVASTPIPPCC